MSAVDTAVPPGQLELVPVAPGAPCTSYVVVWIDEHAASPSAPDGLRRQTEAIRDLPMAAGRAAATAAEHGGAWLVGADNTSCHVDPDGAVAPSDRGWAVLAARVLNNRKDPSLMPPKTLDLSNGPVLLDIELDKIVDHPHNIRVDLGDLTDLARSIADVGILIPITVRPHPTRDGFYEIGDGHRRRGAAEIADGVDTIPSLVGDHTDAAMIEMMLTTGIQRKDISPVEEARGYSYLIELDTSIADLARKMGHTQKYIKGRLALLQLPAAVLALVHTGNLTLGNAEDLLEFAADEEAMAWVVQSRNANDAPWGSALNAVANHVDKREEDAALDAAATELETAGLTRYTKQLGWAYGALDLNQPSKLERLELTAAKHDKHIAEPCHAVQLSVRRRWNDKTNDRDIIEVDKTEICTDPKRHTTKAPESKRSKVQMKPSLYTPGTGQQSKAKKDPAAEAWDAAKTARMAFVTNLIANTEPPPVPDLLAVTIGGEARWFEGIHTDLLDFLGVPYEHNDWGAMDKVWDDFVADPANLPRAVHVLALAIGEDKARRTLNPVAGSRDPLERQQTGAYMATLTAAGYEPSEIERQGLDRLAELEAEAAALAAEEAAALEQRAAEEETPTAEIAAARLNDLTPDGLIALDELLGHETTFGTDPLAPGGVYVEEAHLDELVDAHFVTRTVTDEGVVFALADFARKVKALVDESFEGGFAGFSQDAADVAGAAG